MEIVHQIAVTQKFPNSLNNVMMETYSTMMAALAPASSKQNTSPALTLLLMASRAAN